MDITEVSIIHHIAIVLALLWILVSFGYCHPVAFLVSLLYLYKVNERYSLRMRRRLQFEERKYANQRRLLSDSESVRWLNHAVEKIWPICMEQIASQQFLLPIIPWFLDKYKPWTARKAIVQHLYLGRSPPLFTEIRVLGQSADDDHLVLELGMNFLSADDMDATLAVKLRKRLGFGMWANMHVTGMHVEGKVLVGIKFVRHWPFLGRVRVCFVEPPYFQMTVKPIFNHGVDVTELPGIAGWLDKLLAVAFEQTLVEPNMLVVDVEKFAASPEEGWFTIDEKPPIAHAKVEIVEAADMKPSDLNGLADPYVKGQLGPYRFQTKVQKKTLAPRWFEEFKIPISSWEAPNLLALQVLDKDHIFDDTLGNCSISINELRGGQRHDKWLPLKNIKMGRLHLAVSILEASDDKEKENLSDEESSIAKNDGSLEVADELEPINIEGQENTRIWVHHPGSDQSQTWETRKGQDRHPETELHPEGADSPRSNSSEGDGKHHRIKSFGREMRKLGSLVHRSLKKVSSRNDGEEKREPSPRPNIRAIDEKGVKFLVDDGCIENSKESSGTRFKSLLSKKFSAKSSGDGASETADQDSSTRSDPSIETPTKDPFIIGGSPIKFIPSEHDKSTS